jgi:nitronate monooxygenase
VLLDEIHREWPAKLLLAAGGISDAPEVAAALTTGADGVWVGTALVAAVEANAHPEYQRRLVESDGATLRTTAFGPEWPDQQYRLLATPTVRAAEQSPASNGAIREVPIGHTRLFPHSADMAYDIPTHSALPPTPEAVGELDLMAYPAGHGVANVRSVAPAARIIDAMMSGAYQILAGSSNDARPAQPQSQSRST